MLKYDVVSLFAIGLAAIIFVAAPASAQQGTAAPGKPAPSDAGAVQQAVPVSEDPKSGTALNLANYALTFEDNFDDASIVADGGTGRWFAPIHAPFGAAQFLPPAGGSFSAKDGFLTIRAEKGGGQWRSGLMQTVDAKGNGFAQQYGYFEMRAKFPSGAATWPAFWLLTQNSMQDPKAARGEIDVVEGYGDQPDVAHTSVHIRPFGDRHWFLSKQFKVPGMTQDFHRYGVLIDPVWVKFYVDGNEIYRFPTLEQYKTPFYMVVDLAMTSGKTLPKATDPSDMVIDYVRVYAQKPSP